MKSMQSRLINFCTAISSIENLDNVFHYEKAEDCEDAPYIVWAEEGEGDSSNADNKKQEQVIVGSLDFYTLTEFDPFVDSIQSVLNGLQGCAWRLSSVQQEDATKLIHYTWNWELV